MVPPGLTGEGLAVCVNARFVRALTRLLAELLLVDASLVLVWTVAVLVIVLPTATSAWVWTVVVAVWLLLLGFVSVVVVDAVAVLLSAVASATPEATLATTVKVAEIPAGNVVRVSLIALPLPPWVKVGPSVC